MNKTVVIFLCSVLLTACGWQLRGSQSDTGIQQINLDADDIYTPLYRNFKSEFERRRIELVSDTSAPRLKLLSEREETRIVSYDTEIDPAEEEITLTIRYQINDQIFEAREMQTYQLNKNQLAAHENEKNLLIEQMRQQLSEKVLRQLSILQRMQNTTTP